MIRMIVCGLIVIVGVFLASSQDSIRYVPYNKPLFSDLTPAARTVGVPGPHVNAPPFVSLPAINSDSVGFTYYDYGSNGSSKRTILNYGNGTGSQARTASLMADASYPDRGTYWAYYDGSVWTEDWLRVENARVGWGNLGAFSNGKEVVVAHTGLRITTQNTAHVYDWTTRNTGTGTLGGGFWPAMVVDGADYVHVLHTASGSGNTSAIRYDRYSAGGTVNDVSAANLWQITGADTSIDPRESDGYDIHARGSKVVAVQASENYGWMVLFTSTDNGATWSHQIIESFPSSFPYEVAYIDPYVIIDSNGNPHVVWTTLTATDSSTFNFSATNAIMHWSQSTGRTEVVHISELVDVNVFFTYNTPIAPGGNGGFLMTPSLAVDGTGRLYCAFSAPHSVADTSADSFNRGYYSHIMVAISEDGGATWSNPADINAGLTGYDCMYPNMAGWVGSTGNANKTWWIAGYVDPLPGNNVQNAAHQFTQNAVRVFTGAIDGGDPCLYSPPSIPTGLTATTLGSDRIFLDWNPSEPCPADSYVVFRSLQPGTGYVSVATLPASQTSHLDSALESSTIYYYRVRGTNYYGWSSLSNEDSAMTLVTGLSEEGLPFSNDLHTNHPNPFNPSTTMSFDIARTGPATLRIYNLLGELVTTLHSGNLLAGTHTKTWDGRDRLGRQAASGMYLYRLEAPGFSKTRKMLLIR